VVLVLLAAFIFLKATRRIHFGHQINYQLNYHRNANVEFGNVLDIPFENQPLLADGRRSQDAGDQQPAAGVQPPAAADQQLQAGQAQETPNAANNLSGFRNVPLTPPDFV